MTDYTELVKALRSASTVSTAWEKLMLDAADAIEALQAESTDIREELFVSQREYDNFVAVASMENAMLAKQIPKLGEWIELGYQPNVHETRYRCSLCGRQVSILSGSGDLLKTYPYCHCGAKMEVQDGQ